MTEDNPVARRRAFHQQFWCRESKAKVRKTLHYYRVAESDVLRRSGEEGKEIVEESHDKSRYKLLARHPSCFPGAHPFQNFLALHLGHSECL